MIEQIKDYILNNWDQLGFSCEKPRVLASIQITNSHRRPFEKGKIIYLIFKNNEAVPFCVAKFFRDRTLAKEAKEENKFLSLLHGHGLLFAPRPLMVTTIDNRTIGIESFCPGRTQTLLLQNFIYSSKYTPEGLIGLLTTFMDGVLRIQAGMNTLNQPADTQQFKNEIMELYFEYTRIFSPDSVEKKLIELSIAELLTQSDQKPVQRLVNCDLIPNNIISNEKGAYLIDWEFTKQSSTLTLLEPTRYIFYLLRHLHALNVLETNGLFVDCFEKYLSSDFWLSQITLTLLRESFPFKGINKSNEIALYKNLFIVFFLYEGILQYKMSKFVSPQDFKELRNYTNSLTGYYALSKQTQQQKEKIDNLESFYNKVRGSFAYKLYKSILFWRR